jgi:hypothetical protein
LFSTVERRAALAKEQATLFVSRVFLPWAAAAVLESVSPAAGWVSELAEALVWAWAAESVWV